MRRGLGWLRQFLFGKLMGTLLILLGIVLVGCVLGLALFGFDGTHA